MLISDGAPAIRKAFKSVFKTEKMVMCWAHMLRDCVKKIQLHCKDNMDQEQIIIVLKLLQLSDSRETFDKAEQLFLKKME